MTEVDCLRTHPYECHLCDTPVRFAAKIGMDGHGQAAQTAQMLACDCREVLTNAPEYPEPWVANLDEVLFE
jgi:hypothetical protein